MTSQNQSWSEGQEIEGGYIIQKLLGKGGFGQTYLAKNKQGKHVVIKTINQEISNHTYFRNDFDREAFRLAKLDSHDISSLFSTSSLKMTSKALSWNIFKVIVSIN